MAPRDSDGTNQGAGNPPRRGRWAGTSTTLGCAAEVGHAAPAVWLVPLTRAGTKAEPSTVGERWNQPVGRHSNSDRVRDQVFLRVRSPCSASAATVRDRTVHRARHLFREHCQATPDPMAHLRMAGGIHFASVGWSAGVGMVTNCRLGVHPHSPPASGRILSSSSSTGQAERPKETGWSKRPIGLNAPFRRGTPCRMRGRPGASHAGGGP